MIEKNTPLMQQYFDIKSQHPDTLLFFQVGDFYELFFDDAKRAASFLAITLTKRGKSKGEDIPLCGVPVHALDHYLTKLIKGGFRVALCEQLTKPQPGTVVERGITRVFTPATLTDSSMLDDKTASYLLTFFPGEDAWGLVFGELLTAQLFATIIPPQENRMIESELIRFLPDEIILPDGKKSASFSAYFKKLGYYPTITDYQLDVTDTEQQSIAHEWVSKQLCTKTQALLTKHAVITHNLSLLYTYLKKNQEQALSQFKTVHFYEPDDFVILDPATQRNLELIKNNQDGGRNNTLFSILDRAQTAMGSRTIKKWIQRPLVQQAAITHRHEVVDILCSNIQTMQQLTMLLKNIADLERIIGRVALQRATILDYRALKHSLNHIPELREILSLYILQSGLMATLCNKIADFSALYALLECSINDDIATDQLIKNGYDHHFDRLRGLLTNGQQEILKLEQAEITRTGIGSLKIGYTNISGYYIEVTNTHTDKIPEDYQHQQTLATRKRFVTQALKDLERDLTKAQNELASVEAEVFARVKKEIEEYLAPLRSMAQSISTLDALLSFATAAYEYRYCKPTFNAQRDIVIRQGRHPVVEQTISSSFTPNDTTLTDEESTWLITGPNMGGKSTYLRQTALTCIMAQCGSFVPAQQANLSIIDRIFTRIGSGDNLAEGKSTFLVEMEETATICTQATKNSLVILDEVGRGTSTYDGMALAQAIIEHIHQTIQARCLFATHYHELTHLTQSLKGIATYHAACKKVNDSVLFLHKILPGVAEGSFGLAVAHLAQMPTNIIKRASTILHTLNTTEITISTQQVEPHVQEPQPSDHHRNIIARLQQLDCNTMTPKAALDMLWELCESIRE